MIGGKIVIIGRFCLFYGRDTHKEKGYIKTICHILRL
jgi:hypothetical protein